MRELAGRQTIFSKAAANVPSKNDHPHFFVQFVNNHRNAIIEALAMADMITVCEDDYEGDNIIDFSNYRNRRDR